MACCGKKSSLLVMIFLTTGFFLVEIIVGYSTKSMALVADSFHMLSDVASLFVGFFAVKISEGRQHNAHRNTFGWVRAEILGALVNAVFLVALCFSIFIESMTRFVEPVLIQQPLLVLTVGVIGLVVNLLGMALFRGHLGHGHSHGGQDNQKPRNAVDEKSHVEPKQNSEEAPEDIERSQLAFRNEGFSSRSPDSQRKASDSEHGSDLVNEHASQLGCPCISIDVTLAANKQEMVMIEASTATGGRTINDVPQKPGKASQMNMRGVYLHVLGDALGSVIVIVSALIVYFVDGPWVVYIDPAMSIVLVLIILHSSVPLLKESSLILLQTVPTHIEMHLLESKLLAKFPFIKGVHDFHIWQLTGSKIIASLHVKVCTRGDYMMVCEAMKEFFHNEGIHSTTIQPEFIEEIEKEEISDARNCLLECSSAACEESKCCQNDTLQMHLIEQTQDAA